MTKRRITTRHASASNANPVARGTRPTAAAERRWQPLAAAAWAALGLLAGADRAAAATAPTLPDTYFFVQIGNTSTEYAVAGDYAVGGAHVATSNVPSPSVSTTVATSGTDSARGYMRYSWLLNGPAGMMVPVTIVGSLNVASSADDLGQANAGAHLQLTSGLFTDDVSLEIDRGGFNNNGPTSAHPSFSHLLATGTGGSVILDSFVNARASIYAGASGSAFADPVFTIDPSFAAVDPDYASHYSFSFSPGVGNALPAVAAVPEPGSWALMLGGLAVLGGAVRRRLR